MKRFYSFSSISGRYFRYVLKRMMRLKGTPHSIALGFSFGVFVSFTPFFSFHFILAGILSWLIGGNILASFIGTFFGNPFTFPFIWLASFKLGQILIGTGVQEVLQLDLSKGFWSFLTSHSLESGIQILKLMLAGGLPLGFVFAFFSYWPVRILVRNYQERRRSRLAGKVPLPDSEFP
ncbi:MAG: DUF2062 domain-containing protein [Alphaproteobacteria bacterium]|nr:DUF2062 domain-containing protein [Alphaproteobacteria bacterium]